MKRGEGLCFMVEKHQVCVSQFGEGQLEQIWERGSVGEERVPQEKR